MVEGDGGGLSSWNRRAARPPDEGALTSARMCVHVHVRVCMCVYVCAHVEGMVRNRQVSGLGITYTRRGQISEMFLPVPSYAI